MSTNLILLAVEMVQDPFSVSDRQVEDRVSGILVIPASDASNLMGEKVRELTHNTVLLPTNVSAGAFLFLPCPGRAPNTSPPQVSLFRILLWRSFGVETRRRRPLSFKRRLEFS